MEEEVTERFPGRGVQRLVLLRYGDDPEIEPGDPQARRRPDRAG